MKKQSNTSSSFIEMVEDTSSYSDVVQIAEDTITHTDLNLNTLNNTLWTTSVVEEDNIFAYDFEEDDDSS